MKKFIIMLILLPSLAFARGTMMIAGGNNTTSTACTEVTLGWSLGSLSNAITASVSSNNEYIANQFAAGDWGAITKVQLYISKSAAGSDLSGQTWTIQLYADSTDDPGSKITNGSCTLQSPNTLVPAMGSPAYVGCIFPAAITLTNTTKYHVGINRSGSVDATNSIRYYYDGTGGSGWDMNKDADESGTWGLLDADSYPAVKFFTGSLCAND